MRKPIQEHLDGEGRQVRATFSEKRPRIADYASLNQGRTLVWVALLLSGLLGVYLWFFWLHRSSRTSTVIPLSSLRGEAINPLPATNTHETAAVESRPEKKKRPKPGSLQHRMVDYQLTQAAGAGGGDGMNLGGSPARVIFSPSQLAALPDVPLPSGYQRLGFDTLSAFPYEITRALAEGTNNIAATSVGGWATIPPAVRALDGQLVAIRGFLLPVKVNEGLAFEFLLLRNQNMCCYGSVPKINEWITVQAKGKGIKPIMDQPVTVMGKLHVGEIREQGFLVGLYRLDADQCFLPQSD